MQQLTMRRLIAFISLTITWFPAYPQQCSIASCPWRYADNGDYCSGLSVSEENARKQLDGFSIKINKCQCSATGIDCTEVGGLRQTTLRALTDFQLQYRRSLVITGGTEPGHSDGGIFTHDNGYKVDLRLVSSFNSDPLSLFIINSLGGHFDFLMYRSGGEPVYGTGGPTFAYEFALDILNCKNPVFHPRVIH